MLKVTVVAVGTVKEQYMRDAIAEYVKRMSREYKVTFEECRECATVDEEGGLRLCLSEMTFTHQMTRLILAEQLYRAMKINNGEKYHK